MASESNSMRAMAELMSQMDEDEAVALIESFRDALEALENNPEVLKTFSTILKELSEEEQIGKTFSNLFALAGPTISGLNNAMTPKVVDSLHDLVQDDDVREAIGYFLSVIDPEVLGTLLPEIGSILGEILSDISEDEEAKEHLRGVVLHGGALIERVSKLISKPFGQVKYVSPVGGFNEEDFPLLDESAE